MRIALVTRRSVALVCAVAAAASLTACSSPEYHGVDSGIDGVLWRQVAFYEDPLAVTLYQPTANEPTGYLDALPGMRWDGTSTSLANLDLRDGGVVLYDINEADSEVELSVFIASGPRPNVPTDAGLSYRGPSQVFTCYGIDVRFNPGQPLVGQNTFADCPEALIQLLPDDAAFASAEVFDG